MAIFNSFFVCLPKGNQSSPWTIPPHLLRHAAQHYRALSAQQLRTAQRGAHVVRETHVVQQDHARTGTCRENPMLIEILWRLYGVLRKLYDIIWDCIGFPGNSQGPSGFLRILQDFNPHQTDYPAASFCLVQLPQQFLHPCENPHGCRVPHEARPFTRRSAGRVRQTPHENHTVFFG